MSKKFCFVKSHPWFSLWQTVTLYPTWSNSAGETKNWLYTVTCQNLCTFLLSAMFLDLEILMHHIGALFSRLSLKILEFTCQRKTAHAYWMLLEQKIYSLSKSSLHRKLLRILNANGTKINILKSRNCFLRINHILFRSWQKIC